MSVLTDLFYGFSIALQPWNLLACFIGVFIGTLVGVLPGIGPAGAMSLLLPVTFGMSPVTGIIMLAGIYYGTMYGGSTTSILVNIPGEAASIVTCLDGHQMALKGRAGPALGIAAFGSFIAGTGCIIGLIFMTNALAGVALIFGPTEYFSLMCLGLSLVTYLTQGSILRGLVMAGVGRPETGGQRTRVWMDAGRSRYFTDAADNGARMNTVTCSSGASMPRQ